MKTKCLILTSPQPNLKKKTGRTKCEYRNSSLVICKCLLPHNVDLTAKLREYDFLCSKAPISNAEFWAHAHTQQTEENYD